MLDVVALGYFFYVAFMERKYKIYEYHVIVVYNTQRIGKRSENERVGLMNQIQLRRQTRKGQKMGGGNVVGEIKSNHLVGVDIQYFSHQVKSKFALLALHH